MRQGLMPVLALLLAACSGDAGNQVANGGGPSAPAPGPAAPAGPCVAPLMPGAEANCDFGAQKRMQGVWVRGFEQSAFLPGATGLPGRDYATRDHAWLDFADGVLPDPATRSELDKVQGTVAAAIEFVGRRSRAPGSPIVIVDRIVSMRVLGAVGGR